MQDNRVVEYGGTRKPTRKSGENYWV